MGQGGYVGTPEVTGLKDTAVDGAVGDGSDSCG